MKRTILLLILLVLVYKTRAQETNNTISGIVKDSQYGFLPGATVSLLQSDSTLVQGMATDIDGKFVFKKLPNNTYLISVSSIGNNKYVSIPVVINAQNTNITYPVIVLTPSTTMLQEVVAKANRPLLVQDIDKTTINVDAMIGSAGSNTLEVLEKTPGVTVGTDGAISLNGQGEVLVLIDNRPTYLARQDLALYLKSLPGGSLDKIELMTNPPARYDASGSSIINIRLKKNRLQGFTGNVVVGFSQGTTMRSNNAVNLNYKRGKFNLFTNLSYNKDGNYSRDSYDRKFFDSNNALRSSANLQNYNNYSGRGIAAGLGIDYTASPNTVYGFMMNFQYRPREDQLDYTNYSYSRLSKLDSVGRGGILGNYSTTNLGANFNYQHKFKSGGEITADLNYVRYNTEGRQDLRNVTTLAGGLPASSSQFLYLLPSDITIYTAKSDYQRPLKNKAKLEAGIKSSIVKNSNQSDYYGVKEFTYTPDYSRSNHFIYQENINAAYVNARKDWKRFAIQAGLRVENTQTRGQQMGNDKVVGSTFEKYYTGVFPMMQLRFKLDSSGKHGLNLSLARRINRPNYYQLNPFLFYRDNYSYTTGNPDLNPQYNHIAEAKYQYDQFLNIGLRYGYFTNMIFSTTQAIDNIFITMPNNIAQGTNIALSANLSVSPAKWWNLNANFTYAHLVLKSKIYTEYLNSSINSARFNMFNQFKFNNSLSGELSGFYVSRDMAGQTVIGPRYRVNAGIQKDIFKSKGSVRLIVEDIFHSWVQKDRTLSLRQAESYHINIMDTRRIGLAFTFRFGKETFARKRKHTDNAADEEKGRAIE